MSSERLGCRCVTAIGPAVPIWYGFECPPAEQSPELDSTHGSRERQAVAISGKTTLGVAMSDIEPVRIQRRTKVCPCLRLG